MGVFRVDHPSALRPVDGASVGHDWYKITNESVDFSAKILTQGSVIRQKPGLVFTVPSGPYLHFHILS